MDRDTRLLQALPVWKRRLCGNGRQKVELKIYDNFEDAVEMRIVYIGNRVVMRFYYKGDYV